MIIYYTAVDNGDGSIGVEFYDSFEPIMLLEEHDFERYRGEGGGSFEALGFSKNLYTMEDAMKHLTENLGISEDFIIYGGN